jgi:hypothetical protein
MMIRGNTFRGGNHGTHLRIIFPAIIEPRIKPRPDIPICRAIDEFERWLILDKYPGKLFRI